jgi:hypothetical protein
MCVQYPMLQRLEAEGVVEVACAKNQTKPADWRNASDWTVGTFSDSCKPPPPSSPAPGVSIASAAEQELITVATRK